MEKQTIETMVGTLDKRMNRQLKEYLDICVRCAICKDACHQYVATQDMKYLPARRAELIREIYRKYFTKAGEFVPALYEARDPDDNMLDELYDSTYACTGCRRCMFYCPFSIDTAWITSVAKAMLIAAGRGNEMLGQLADAEIFKGDNIEMFRDSTIDGFKDIEAEVRRMTGNPEAEIPVDRQGADILYVALAGAHSILPAAVIFNEAGASWTLSMFESANYGFFFGDPTKAKLIADRFMNEAKRLGVKEVVITECGHAYRVAEMFYEAWAKEKMPFKVRHILEVIDDYIKQGRITVDAKAIAERVTYHDPCQIGRNGGIFEQPRDIVRGDRARLRRHDAQPREAVVLRRRRRHRRDGGVQRRAPAKRREEGRADPRHGRDRARVPVRELPPADRRAERGARPGVAHRACDATRRRGDADARHEVPRSVAQGFSGVEHGLNPAGHSEARPSSVHATARSSVR